MSWRTSKGLIPWTQQQHLLSLPGLFRGSVLDQGNCLSSRNASAASTVRNGRNIHQATAVNSMLNTSDLSGSIPFVQYLHPDTFTILLWMTNKCVTNDCHVVPLRLEQFHLQPSKHIRNRHIQLCVCKTISHSQALALDFDDDWQGRKSKGDKRTNRQIRT